MVPWSEEQSGDVTKTQESLPPWILDIVELYFSLVDQFGFLCKESETYLGVTSAAPQTPLKGRCEEWLLMKCQKF